MLLVSASLPKIASLCHGLYFFLIKRLNRICKGSFINYVVLSGGRFSCDDGVGIKVSPLYVYNAFPNRYKTVKIILRKGILEMKLPSEV